MYSTAPADSAKPNLARNNYRVGVVIVHDHTNHYNFSKDINIEHQRVLTLICNYLLYE